MLLPDQVLERYLQWKGKYLSGYTDIYCVTIRSLSLYLFAGYGRSLNSSQVRVMAVTVATGSFTLEASPLLQNKTKITSTIYKLFIYLKVKLCNFLRASKE
jgi:hypothetical protein